MTSGYRGKGRFHFGLRYALNGLKVAVLTERNIKIHLLAALLVIIAAIVLSFSIIEWAIVCLAMSAVISMELMNTALERALDHLEPEQQELIGVAKDMAAAAVLVTAIFAIAIACFIILPKILTVLSIASL